MEREDLIEYYEDYEGDMASLLECIPLSTNGDIDRFLAIYEDLFAEKVLKKNKKFNSTKNKISLVEEDDAEEVQKEKEKFDDLYKQIMGKKVQRTGFVDNLRKSTEYFFRIIFFL
jgi:DnaJ family protein C protein 9